MAVDHAAILEALRAGESQNAVARRLGCSPGTVNRVARLNGIEWHSTQKKEPSAEPSSTGPDYAQERRIALLNRAFGRAEQMVDAASKPSELQALAIALGILIDKRRLEDGEVTERTEEVDGGSARERLADRLDDLAARRRQAAGA